MVIGDCSVDWEEAFGARSVGSDTKPRRVTGRSIFLRAPKPRAPTHALRMWSVRRNAWTAKCGKRHETTKGDGTLALPSRLSEPSPPSRSQTRAPTHALRMRSVRRNVWSAKVGSDTKPRRVTGRSIFLRAFANPPHLRAPKPRAPTHALRMRPVRRNVWSAKSGKRHETTKGDGTLDLPSDWRLNNLMIFR